MAISPKTSRAESTAATSAPLLSAAPLTPRGARTRVKLIAAAQALFERDGYLETNVADIAKRARVAHGTFYTYFDSKEDVFSEVADALVVDFASALLEEPQLPSGHSVSERIEQTNRSYLRVYARRARMMAVLEEVATFNPRLAAIRRTSRRMWVQRNTAAVRRWKEQGLIDPAIDPAYAASVLGSMVDRSAYVWNVLGEPHDFEIAVEQLTRLYCNALGLECHLDRKPDD
ncbi:TetR/AcrR family transcriptional regulator [Ilumatobacter sp.]|uniref:TetR/AcrR family transcriptional regulator n=1 Tax=Ilumatobacter sp. TaxID=1967498 RepID=UPI003752CAA6